MGLLLSCPETALAAAGIVGQWESDVDSGTVKLDPAGASFMCGRESLSGIALKSEEAINLIDEADRGRVAKRLAEIKLTGGPILMEFQAILPKHGLRHLQVRGYYAWDERGRMIGRGVVIDLTDQDSALAAAEVEAARPSAPRQATPDPLAEAAERGIELRSVLGRSGHGALRLAADLLLWEINTALAARHTVSDKVVAGISKPFR